MVLVEKRRKWMGTVEVAGVERNEVERNEVEWNEVERLQR